MSPKNKPQSGSGGTNNDRLSHRQSLVTYQNKGTEITDSDLEILGEEKKNIDITNNSESELEFDEPGKTIYMRCVV